MSNPKDLIEDLLPNHFLEQYPQFIKFLEQYYEFLESSIVVLRDNKKLKVGDTIYGSLSKAKATVRIVSSDRIYFEYNTKDNNFYKNEVLINGNTGELYYTTSVYKNIYAYMQDIEDNTCYDMVLNLFKKYFRKNVSLDKSIFRRVDPNLLTKRILDYYKNKDTENSFYWFFRIFFDETIDLYYPKVDILRVSDSDYRVRRWMQIRSTENYIQFRQARIFAPNSNSSAFVREVNTTSVNGIVKIFLDLTFINGEFLPNEEIIAYDYITGEEIGRTRTLLSVTKVKPTDGGIGHYVGDRFKFNNKDSDGRGVVSKLEKFSVTNINQEYDGILYRAGEYLTFDNTYTGATAFANAYVETINKNDFLTDYVNDFNKYIRNLPVSLFFDKSLEDIVEDDDLFGEIDLNYKLSSSSYIDEYDIGSINTIRIDKSGLDYNFEPNVTAVTDVYAAKKLFVFDVLFDEAEANVSFITEDTEVEIYEQDSLCIGTEIIGSTSLNGLEIDSEDVVARQFIFPIIELPLTEHVISSYIDTKIEDPISETSTLTFENASISTYAPLLLAAPSTVTIKSSGLTAEIQDVISFSPLTETARLSSVLGEGVKTLSLTELGLNGLSGAFPVFKDIPEERTFDQPDIAHGLSASLEYEYGVVFEPFGEYLGNGSKVSSDKYLQDGYYYQNFSYEIRTKVPASLIEPLLMDELHPAGFIAFIRNKFEAELKLRMLAMEFPEIEIESFAFMDTFVDQFTEIELDNGLDSLKEVAIDEFSDIEAENIVYTDTTATQQFEIELEQYLDELKGFHYFWEDVIVLPQEFDLNSFDGYMDSYEEAKIINSTVVYDLIPVVYSYFVLMNVEDQANWRTVPVKYRQGPIGNMADDTIDNLRVLVELTREHSFSMNEGGVLIVRDDPTSSPIALGNATNSYKNHGLLPTAEVYTRSGWIQFQNVKPRTEIAHVERNGKVTWRVLNKIHKQFYDGVLYQIENETTKFTVAPETDVVLFDAKNEYKRVKAKSVNLNDSKYYFAGIDETKINSPFSAISAKTGLSSFNKTEINYTGDIYIISVNVEKYSIPVKSEFTEIDILLSNVVDPRNYPEFTFKFLGGVSDVEYYKHLPDRNKVFDVNQIISPFVPLAIRPYKKSELRDYLGDTIPAALDKEKITEIEVLSESQIESKLVDSYKKIISASDDNDLNEFLNHIEYKEFEVSEYKFVDTIANTIFETVYNETHEVADVEFLESFHKISQFKDNFLKELFVFKEDEVEYDFQSEPIPLTLVPNVKIIENISLDVIPIKLLESQIILFDIAKDVGKLNFEISKEDEFESNMIILDRNRLFNINQVIAPYVPQNIKDRNMILRDYVKDAIPGVNPFEDHEVSYFTNTSLPKNLFEIDYAIKSTPTDGNQNSVFNYDTLFKEEKFEYDLHVQTNPFVVNSNIESIRNVAHQIMPIEFLESDLGLFNISEDVGQIQVDQKKEDEFESNLIIPDRNKLFDVNSPIFPLVNVAYSPYLPLTFLDYVKFALPAARVQLNFESLRNEDASKLEIVKAVSESLFHITPEKQNISNVKVSDNSFSQEKNIKVDGLRPEEIYQHFLTSQWFVPFLDNPIDDFVNRQLISRELTYLHRNLAIQYTHSESFIYDTSELLNSNNYIVDYSSSSNTIVKMNFLDNVRTLT